MVILTLKTEELRLGMTPLSWGQRQAQSQAAVSRAHEANKHGTQDPLIPDTI